MDNGVDPVPQSVRSFARHVLEKIGEEPRIEQVAPLTWRITLAGERIIASADYRSSLGKTKYSGGELTIDGKSRPIVDWPELRVLWDQYERPAGHASVEPMPPLPEDAKMPAEARKLHDQLTATLQGKAPAQAGYDGRWVIGVDGPGGDGVRFIFTRIQGGRWALAGKLPIQVVAGGNDLSAGVGRDVAKAMAVSTGTYTGSDAPSNGPAGKTTQGARDNGIEFRKGNVIRVLRPSLDTAKALGAISIQGLPLAAVRTGSG